MKETKMDDPNKPETEEDGIQAGALRLLKARRQSEAFMAQTRALSQSQNDTPQPTASPSDDKPNTSK